MQRILFGLDRLPRTLQLDDPRLPGVMVGKASLRLNTEALPAEVMDAAAASHGARLAAMKQFLRKLCGDYAPQRLRFIDHYMDCMAAHLEEHRSELARGLQRYDGLYTPDDWLWSALRPLPRAWLPGDAGLVPVDFAFWDGTRAIAIDLGGARSLAGIVVCRIEPDVLTNDPSAMLDVLPDSFRRFWSNQKLPVSPFRRPIPRGAVREITPAS